MTNSHLVAYVLAATVSQLKHPQPAICLVKCVWVSASWRGSNIQGTYMYSAPWELLLLCENIQYVSAFECGVSQCNECCVAGLCVFLVENLKAMASPLCSPFSVAVWHAAHWPRNGPHSSHLQLWMNQRGEAIVDIEGRVGDTLDSDLMSAFLFHFVQSVSELLLCCFKYKHRPLLQISCTDNM